MDSVIVCSSTDIAPQQQQTNMRLFSCPSMLHSSNVEFQPMQVSAQLGIDTAHNPMASRRILSTIPRPLFSSISCISLHLLYPHSLRSRSQECGSFSPRRPTLLGSPLPADADPF
ncbi:uncharacterized protein TrAtP1_009868 [Trichoderma atroviride]|uniref:Uncharacterized protein n=1 Tax=Hypocrea atroviridis (strain ATCC 20476 / IMI 206040) TaxID=452589 RepID=G9NKH0_HYPAI|nr:uncharacterized protein TRIATDRAFT_297967 [Trichoderma atroviride IMI 206040]EHK48393.1 hypothetical protein TRIATDRAFT_297967 [Trichoderma atroviride IMI 206040]UKZ68848.1 hypothetical protein TrAtP1_009868 [Trichoderma atroviride]